MPIILIVIIDCNQDYCQIYILYFHTVMLGKKRDCRPCIYYYYYYYDNLDLIISKLFPELLLIALVYHHNGWMAGVLSGQPARGLCSRAFIFSFFLPVLPILLPALW